jgi:uncharacterized membrane protein YbhN (UPF0104 family)/tRNA A-37 threonylcarbamoyl transferase component Bud32
VSRYFVSEHDQPRVQRAADAVMVVTGLVLLLWTAVNADRILAFEEALLALVSSVPSWFDQAYRLIYFVGLVMVVALVVAMIAQGRRRLDLLRDILLAFLTTLGLGLLLTWWIDGELPTAFPEFSSAAVEPLFPVMRVALMTGVIAVSAPHLTRPLRRTGWTLVVLVTIAAFGLGFGMPSDAVGGVGLGLVIAGSILLIFGSPRGYPDVDGITEALAELGLVVDSLSVTPDQSWGTRRLAGVLDDGTEVEVKAYGRDATDSQLMNKAWRKLWYRDEGQQFTFSRLQSVEHEALAILMAHRLNVASPDVLAVGIAGDDVALLVTTRPGEPVDDEAMTHQQLVAIWRQLDRLHRGRIAHGNLTRDAVTLDDDQPVFHEFTAASFSASDARLSLDIVSLLFGSATVVGVEPAVAAALDGVGTNPIVNALPFLQVPALSRTQRKAAPKPKQTVNELRAAVADTTETELPPPAKLRRVTPKDLVMPALSLIAAYALIGMLSDIDFVAVWEVLEDATWTLILIAFVVGQFVYLPEATGMLYATGYPLPLKPLVVLQLSVNWIGLAVPSAAGRVTMNTLFLRKFGVPTTIALTQGAIDGVAGFLVEAGILLVALISSDLTLDLDTDEINWQVILMIVAVLIAGSVIAVLRVQRLRDMILPPLKDAWGNLRGVIKDPKRTLGLLGSNLAARIVLAITLWFVLQAIGAPLPLVTCLVITVATNLLAGLVPIPGGIGVAEAVLTSFLTLAGLEADEAFAAAVVFRIATFYLPAAAGFFAMKWLETNEYL